jgi:STAM-binding protein
MNLPLPNKETLSRHSFLGPNGLRGQWLGPSAEIKVKLMFESVMLSDHE